MSGEVVDFGFVSKEEAQVKRYKKPLIDAAMKEKKESQANSKTAKWESRTWRWSPRGRRGTPGCRASPSSSSE